MATEMLQGRVPTTLLRMAVPTSIAMLSTFLFQVVDTYFVGQLGPEPLAALGFSASVYFASVAVFMGLAVGMSALVGNALGAADLMSARRTTSLGVLASVLVAAAIAAAGLLGLEPLFSTLGASAEIIPLIDAYMGTLFFGLPVLVFGLVGNATIRAAGGIRADAIVFGVAGLINVALDYILMFPLGMGLEGAAVATVVSWWFIALSSFVMLRRGRFLVRRVPQPWAILREFVRISSPAVATQVLLPLTAMVITVLAARSGPDVVAAIGVASRIESLALVGISAMSVALVPFISQNHGAGHVDRVRQAVQFSRRAAWIWGAGVFVVLVALARPIAEVFSDDAAIVGHTTRYFFVIAVTYGAAGVVTMASSVFNGVMQPRAALQVLLVKTVVLGVPLAVLGSFFGPTGLFASVALTNVLAAVFVWRRQP